MTGFRRQELRQVDALTGELVDGFVAVVQAKRKNGFRQGWVAMAQDALSLLARSDLTLRDYKVLMELLARLDFENLIQINQAEIDKDLKIGRAHISRSISKLKAIGALLEGPKIGVHKTYRLNPHFGWKGSAKSHHQALKERMRAARIEAVIDGSAAQEKAPERDPRVPDMFGA